MRKIDVEELSKTISEIVAVRNIQKAKMEQKRMIEEFQEEEIEKFQKPVVEEVTKIVPAIEQSSTQTAKAIESSNMKMIEQLKDVSTLPQLSSTIPQLPSTRSLPIDPDKDLDLELINE
jgi:hypothetical protein